MPMRVGVSHYFIVYYFQGWPDHHTPLAHFFWFLSLFLFFSPFQAGTSKKPQGQTHELFIVLVSGLLGVGKPLWQILPWLLSVYLCTPAIPQYFLCPMVALGKSTSVTRKIKNSLEMHTSEGVPKAIVCHGWFIDWLVGGLLGYGTTHRMVTGPGSRAVEKGDALWCETLGSLLKGTSTQPSSRPFLAVCINNMGVNARFFCGRTSRLPRLLIPVVILYTGAGVFFSPDRRVQKCASQSNRKKNRHSSDTQQIARPPQPHFFSFEKSLVGSLAKSTTKTSNGDRAPSRKSPSHAY